MAIVKDVDILFDLKISIISAIKNGCTTIDKIYLYLSKKYTKEQIKYCLNLLLVEDESIVRNDYYYGESNYELVSERQKKSSYTKNYRNFIDDNPNKKKKILLISDTHLGNNELENMILINTVYEYAKQENCDFAFHLGDLFEGNNSKEINTFIEKYPNYIKTVCLLGNHDQQFNNLKFLNAYNDSFNVYETSRWSTKLNNNDIHLSHRFYISWLIEDQKINCIDDIDEVDDFLSNDFRVLISGHLHQGIIYIKNNYQNKETIYLGVPSLSNTNINKSCAYIMTIDNDIIDISVLTVSNNYEIKEIDNIELKDQPKFLKKVY